MFIVVLNVMTTPNQSKTSIADLKCSVLSRVSNCVYFLTPS